MDFFSFERAALRLKEALSLHTDKDLAAQLGLDVSAYNKRKARGSFPEKELRALKEQRPDLGIDVEYVLHGASLTPRQKQSGELIREVLEKAQGTLAQEVLDELSKKLLVSERLMAEQSARRHERYTAIIELLNDCSDDSLDLLIGLIDKMRLGDVSRKQSAHINNAALLADTSKNTRKGKS